MEQLAYTISQQGAKVNGKVYKIPPIGRTFGVPKFDDVSPVYAGTVHVEQEDGSVNIAYGAAGKYHTVYVSTRSSAIKDRSNLSIQRLYEPYIETNVSIYLTADGKFLEPRQVDVIVANSEEPIDRLPDILAACSSYEVTVVSEEFKGKLTPYIYKYRGLIRCLAE